MGIPCAPGRVPAHRIYKAQKPLFGAVFSFGNPLAFLSGFAFGILSQAVMVPRAMYYGFRELQFVDGFAQISEQFYLQALFGSAAFVLSFILMLVVFTGSFLIFRHREKQSLRESEE